MQQSKHPLKLKAPRSLPSNLKGEEVEEDVEIGEVVVVVVAEAAPTPLPAPHQLQRRQRLQLLRTKVHVTLQLKGTTKNCAKSTKILI